MQLFPCFSCKQSLGRRSSYEVNGVSSGMHGFDLLYYNKRLNLELVFWPLMHDVSLLSEQVEIARIRYQKQDR